METVKMADLRTPTPSKGRTQIPIVCPGHTRPLAELEFRVVKENGKDHSFLVSACHDKLPMIRDAKTGDWIGTFKGHKGAVWSCTLDPKAYLAATASGDFTVKLWDAVTGKLIHEYPHKHIVKTVAFSPDSLKMATGGHEGVLRVYDLEKGSKCIPKEIPISTNKQDKCVITKCVWYDENLVLVASSDKAIRIWDGSKLHIIFRVEAEVRDIELSKNSFGGMDILTVASGKSVYFFHIFQEQLLQADLLHKHEMPIHFLDEGGASLHPNGSKFIAGGSDLWVRVFDFESGEELECHKGHHGPIRCLRYAPDGQTYATGSEDGTIRIWKTDP